MCVGVFGLSSDQELITLSTAKNSSVLAQAQTRTSKMGEPERGSWYPLIVVLFIALVRFIVYSRTDAAILMRRWFKIQYVKLRTKLGFRDDTIYTGGAGQGASARSKRQG